MDRDILAPVPASLLILWGAFGVRLVEMLCPGLELRKLVRLQRRDCLEGARGREDVL